MINRSLYENDGKEKSFTIITCPHCNKEIHLNASANSEPIDDKLQPLLWSTWYTKEDITCLRVALPDENEGSIPSLYKKKYGKRIPLNWKKQI